VSGGFRRSGLFGIIGIIVVAVLAAVFGLTLDEGDADPKLTLTLIFGVIAVFVVGLLVLQRADLERAADGAATATSDAVASGGDRVEDPTALAEPELWAAMAVAPIDAEALRARGEGSEVGRRSLRLVAAALYGAARAIGPGGGIDSGFDRVEATMKPLGLRLAERPGGSFELRSPTMPGADYRLRGPTVLSGERHGRAVTVRLGNDEDPGASEVAVAEPGCHPFEAGSKLVEVRSGREGIAVSRRRGGAESWLCDLWLAERLAAG
jgi:hypothetical protein